MAIAALSADPTEPRVPCHSFDDGAAGSEPAEDDPEARLRTAAAAGDRAAFATLYANYHDTVFQYLARRCRGDRHLAEDLTQDTFTRALSRLTRYRETGRPFVAWLVTIAGNLLADYWRSAWYRRHVTWSDFTGDTGEGLLSEDSDSDPAVEVVTSDRRQQLARTLADAIGKLSDRQRQVVSLRYAKGLSVADTAHVLGVDEGAVKAATYRARRALACDPTVEELR